MLKVIPISFGLVGLLMAVNGSSLAADSTTMAMSANVIGTCKYSTTPALAFGVLDQTLSTDATASGNLQFWCTKGASYTLSDQANPGVGDGAFAGAITNGTDAIPYTITYNNFTGNGAGKTTLNTSTLTAKILNGDYVNVSAGAYTGTVTFTVAP